MNKDFCDKICFPTPPPCLVFKILRNNSIEDLLNKNKFLTVDNLVCHKCAQDIVEDKIVILENCDECMLCKICCPNFLNSNIVSSQIEKAIFSNLVSACIYFTATNPNLMICSEAKAVGNFRSKRIDLVIKQNKTVYLIKVLKNFDKSSFYLRSYENVKEYYSSLFPSYNFNIFCLVPENNANCNHSDNRIVGLSALATLLTEV